jgi:hypothetical protein
MSDPLTGTGAVLGGGLLGSVLYGSSPIPISAWYLALSVVRCFTLRQQQTLRAVAWQGIS